MEVGRVRVKLVRAGELTGVDAQELRRVECGYAGGAVILVD